LILGRSLYSQKLRLQWEEIFEQGAVTRDGLNRHVSRIFNAAPALGLTPLQKAQIAAISEQFWANYTYLRDLPLDPARGWTEKQKFLALHAKVGEYQITVAREANLQDSSITALDARRWLARGFKLVTLGTYAVNDAVAGKWV
jgi:hypothetical protein